MPATLPQNTIGKLKTGEKARLLTWLNVREGVFEHCTALSTRRRSPALMLTSVNGVGLKAASIPVGRTAGQTGAQHYHRRKKMLMQAPGIGKKIAQRMYLSCATR